jgi:hypothetical protein
MFADRRNYAMNASQRKWTRRAILLGTAQATAAGVILADRSSASPIEPQQDAVPAVASDLDDITHPGALA